MQYFSKRQRCINNVATYVLIVEEVVYFNLDILENVIVLQTIYVHNYVFQILVNKMVTNAVKFLDMKAITTAKSLPISVHKHVLCKIVKINVNLK